MKTLVQRVTSAQVLVEGRSVARIGSGLLVYLALERDDQDRDLDWTVRKVLEMRVFEDVDGKMNDPLGPRPVLLVSQFTLTGDFQRGRRPGFERALPVEEARVWWPRVVERFRAYPAEVHTGTFQASMQVESVNDGPATFWLDSGVIRHG